MIIKTTSSLILLLVATLFSLSHASEDDIRCLKSIKSSLEDPFDRLSSWEYTNVSYYICRFVGVTCWNNADNKILAIDLSRMNLRGHFPAGIEHCKSLTHLNLSHNSLSGPIPPDISRLIPFVTELDLSYNNFSGEIPSNTANCSYLNVLRLDHNRLDGNLPRELGLLQRIRALDVSDNNLSGSVPDFGDMVRISEDSFGNNRELCGGPLKACLTDVHERGDDSFQLGFGIGYAISFLVAFLCFSVSTMQAKSVVKMAGSLIVRRRKAMNEVDQIVRSSSLKHKNQITQLENLVNKMSFAEISKATENFSDVNVIGIGKMGTMYKATLPNGWFLAVKRLPEDPEKFEAQFVSELLALSRMRHDNLVPLLGFSMENNEKLLVYKYMSNGSLYDWLHNVGNEAKFLRWPLRVKIAAGTARGLAWLHHKCIFRVVHRSISSKSVLLDRFFEPKISNFGSAIVSNHGGAMFLYENEGDSGILVSGEAWESRFVKRDVYDFGIVLLELITGEEIGSRVSSVYSSLIEWANRGSVLNDAVDKHLIGEGFDGEILQLLRVAVDCVNPVQCRRPTMLSVYEGVSNIGLRYGIPCDFRILV